MTFDEYLELKKIDGKTFQKRDSEQFSILENLFNQMHPNSFTAQKLFLINRIRRNYPVKEDVVKVSEKPKQPKPKFTPRIKK